MQIYAKSNNMPYDPTFKNLYPYPDKKQIREELNNQILTGKLAIPKEYALDSRSWITDETEKIYRAERKKYDESEGEAIAAWQKYQEEDFGFDKLPEVLKQKIHSYVWEKGHSGGYSEMQNWYADTVDLVMEAFDLGKKAK